MDSERVWKNPNLYEAIHFYPHGPLPLQYKKAEVVEFCCLRYYVAQYSIYPPPLQSCTYRETLISSVKYSFVRAITAVARSNQVVFDGPKTPEKGKQNRLWMSVHTKKISFQRNQEPRP